MKTKTSLILTSRRHLAPVVLLLATVALLALAPRPVHAGLAAPFSASFTTNFKSFLQSPQSVLITVNGRGTCNQMGKVTATTSDQVVSLTDGSATATYKIVGAHGDSLILAIALQTTNVSGGVTFAGSYTVIGGTGEYANAAGSGVLAGAALFTSESAGIGSFSLSGATWGPGD